MSYQKPELVAKSEPKQSYVGGCPPQGRHSHMQDICINCERTM